MPALKTLTPCNCRAAAAGMIAFGSKAATMLKGAGGAGTLVKSLGGLAVGGGLHRG